MLRLLLGRQLAGCGCMQDSRVQLLRGARATQADTRASRRGGRSKKNHQGPSPWSMKLGMILRRQRHHLFSVSYLATATPTQQSSNLHPLAGPGLTSIIHVPLPAADAPSHLLYNVSSCAQSLCHAPAAGDPPTPIFLDNSSSCAPKLRRGQLTGGRCCPQRSASCRSCPSPSRLRTAAPHPEYENA